MYPLQGIQLNNALVVDTESGYGEATKSLIFFMNWFLKEQKGGGFICPLSPFSNHVLNYINFSF